MKAMMKGKDLNSKNEGKGGDAFIDRSKVRILLCDNDSKSLDEVVLLLLKCSYQVITVRSARQVIDALNAEGSTIDIILAELDLPMTKGMKMLKYIMKDKDLRRIPVIMMSAQDEVSVVVNCLKLGAADYLVKPLRTNELLNLWTHMWRRRRVLGLAERNLLNYDFNHLPSDPSDADTNSTNLFSDDTDKSLKSINLEVGPSTRLEAESVVGSGGKIDGTATLAATGVAAVEFAASQLEFQRDVPAGKDCHKGQLLSGPKKNELKIAKSSAFFTYVKSNVLRSSCPGASNLDDIGYHHSSLDVISNHRPSAEGNVHSAGDISLNESESCENEAAYENCSLRDDLHASTGLHVSLERPCSLATSSEFLQKKHKDENLSQISSNPRNGSHALGLSTRTGFSQYMPGVMNQHMLKHSGQMPQKNLSNFQGHSPPNMPSQYNHMPQCNPHVNGMAPFPYYPFGICLQQGQISAVHAWPSVGCSPSTEANPKNVDRREAALIKFRQKRKDRCFDKKIRYVNRKKLAERRPRLRGQFVRKVNGVNVDLNGHPDSGDYDEDEDEEKEGASRDSSPEGYAL